MKDKYRLYLKEETEVVEEAHWRVAKSYPTMAELELDLSSIPEAKTGKARGGRKTPLWGFAIASPILAIGYILCFALWLVYGLWKMIATAVVEAGRMLMQAVRMFEQWRYDKSDKRKGE